MLPFLAADVGGTYARVALVQVSAEREIELLAYRKLACADFPGLPQLLESFVQATAAGRVRQCVLACAGYLEGDEVLNDNLAWPIHLAQLRRTPGFDEVAVLNDLEALGYALDDSPDGDSQLLCGPEGPTSTPKAPSCSSDREPALVPPCVCPLLPAAMYWRRKPGRPITRRIRCANARCSPAWQRRAVTWRSNASCRVRAC